MIKQYSHQDIERWAEFSGDRNKVHFDKKIAIQNGLRDVIAQGMLVLLDAKLMMSPYLTGDSSLDFYIKKSVFVDTDMKYDIKESNNKTFLTVSELDSQDEACVTATLISQNQPTLKKASNKVQVPPEFVKFNIGLLKSFYPHINDSWLLMDTLLFSICFNQQKDDYFYRQAQKIAHGNEEDKITTFHVAHKVFVSEQLLNYSHIEPADLSYSIEENDVYISDDSAYSTFDINAIENDKIIYQSSIGCMTKSHSL